MTALAIRSSFRATAISATFDGLPLALSRWAESRSGPGTWATARAPMYSARRTSRRPPRMCRSPRRRPLSDANGATPASAASLPGGRVARESASHRFSKQMARSAAVCLPWR